MIVGFLVDIRVRRHFELEFEIQGLGNTVMCAQVLATSLKGIQIMDTSPC